MTDLLFILKWWLYLVAIGLLFLPITAILFPKFIDKGYIFSKSLGIAITSYLVLVFGITHILPFHRLTIFLILMMIIVIDYLIIKKIGLKLKSSDLKVFTAQETLFLGMLIFWCYIKGFQPDIHGLEKFMDFGFMNSILRSNYFPPTDIWFPPFSINYYYFGHLTTAVLIKLTNIPGYISYNLMLSTILAFTFTSALSIVATMTINILKSKKKAVVTGILAGLITTFAGNLQTIYTFFKQYNPPDNPVPFWQLGFAPSTFPNNYWYPNATRFIPFTIHEFPLYSFVVSDLHGHVLDIPFVLLTIGIVYSIFLNGKINYLLTILIGFMLAVMYMTNAWDGIIYMMLFAGTVMILNTSILKIKKQNKKSGPIKQISIHRIANKISYTINSAKYIAVAFLSFVIFSLPFSIGFKPFVSGIGIICAPDFLAKIKIHQMPGGEYIQGKLGPFLFEADHCARSPLWMLIILYGFFYFFIIFLVIKIIKMKKTSTSVLFILMLILLATTLIAIPEFIYAKDIYPAHYRANTMFKLGYQAFIMLSLVTSFAIAYLLSTGKKVIWLPISAFFLFLVMIYPYFAINSYFGEIKHENYKGLNGLSYLKNLYPDDYDAIMWIQNNIKGQPIILESQGDSYTDHGRVSANTGLPTPLGWTVHEWLWRGEYKFPESRLSDITNLYQADTETTKRLIKKYNISLIYVGTLEKTKYELINEGKFREIGSVIYQDGDVTIYKVTN